MVTVIFIVLYYYFSIMSIVLTVEEIAYLMQIIYNQELSPFVTNLIILSVICQPLLALSEREYLNNNE